MATDARRWLAMSNFVSTGFRSTPASIRPGAVGVRPRRTVFDSWITCKVKAVLASDSGANASHLSVTTRRGVVHLGGSLADQDAIARIRALVAQTEGVRDVNTTALMPVLR